MRTIIFLSGLGVPKLLAKSRFVWNDSFWKDYHRIYITSKIPFTNEIVEKEINRLCNLMAQFDNPIIAGHSLGAWWAANLACSPQSIMKKMVLLTPLGDAAAYPILNVSSCHHPINKKPNNYNVGPNRTLLVSATYDLVVPAHHHSNYMVKLFQPLVYQLNGGHFYQKNHQNGLIFMKNWIEID